MAPSPRRLAADAAWTMAARILAQGAQFAAFILAARQLGPADFGIFTLVLIFSLLVTHIASAGWREYLLAHDEGHEALQSLAWGLGLAGALLFAGGGLAYGALTGAEEVAALSALLALSIPFTAGAALQAGRLVAIHRVPALAQIQIAAELVHLAAVYLALAAGSGLLALGLAKLAGSLVLFFGALLVTRWTRLALPRRAELGAILAFSRAILASRLTFFAQENLSSILIGAFLGPQGTGLYRAGARIAGALADITVETLRLSAWSSFRAAGQGAPENGALSGAVQNLLSVALMLGLPAFIGLSLLAPLLVELLLGPEWAPAGLVLALLALRRLLMFPQGALEPMLALLRKAPLIPRYTLASTLVSLLALLLAAPFGIHWTAAGQLAAALLMLPVLAWLYGAIGGVSLRALSLGLAAPLIAAALMALAVAAALEAPVTSGWLRLALASGTGALVYGACLLALSPRARTALGRGLRAGRGRPGGPM